MYLAKRPSYEFMFAIPEDHPLFLNADRALFRMRFRNQRQTHDIVLNLDELEDFYERGFASWWNISGSSVSGVVVTCNRQGATRPAHRGCRGPQKPPRARTP